MGWFSQLGLVLKKNFIQRRRHPVLLVFEVIWPVAIFLAVAIVRQGAGPLQKQECVYNPRAMPSAGIVPFIETFICNINNQCKNKTDQVVAGATAGARIGKVVDDLEPVLSQKDTKDVLEKLPENIKTLDSINEVLERDDVKKFIEANMTLARFFTDPGGVEDFLVSQLGVLQPNIVKAMLEATVNMTKLLELTKDIKFKEIVCDEKQLASYLLFPPGTNVTMVSREMCNINESLIPSIVEKLQAQINIASIVKLVSELSNVFGNYTLTRQLEDVATMVDLVLHYTPLSMALENYPELASLATWVKKISTMIVNYVPTGELDLSVLGGVMEELDPLITKWTNNSEVWQDIKKSIYYTDLILNWVNNGLTKLPELQLTFGMLFENETSVKDYILTTTKVTPEIIQALLGAKVDRIKLQNLLNKYAGTNTTLKDIFCKDSGYFEIFTFALGTDVQEMKNVHSSLCRLNITVLGAEFDDAFKIEAIVRQLAVYDESRVGEQTLNWTQIISTGQSLFNTIDRLMKSYIGDFTEALTKLDLTSLWGNLGNIVTASSNSTTDATKVIQDSLLQILSGIQPVLESQPGWDHTRMWLIVSDLVMDVIEDMADYAHGVHRYYSVFLKDSPFLQDALNAFSAMGPEATASIISGLTTPRNIQKIIKDPSHLSELFCNESIIEVFFNLPPGVNTADIKNHMCNLDLSGLTEKVRDVANFTQITESFQQLMAAFDPAFTVTADMMAKGNLVNIAQHSFHITTKITEVVMEYTETLQTVNWPVLDLKWNTTAWEKTWADISATQLRTLTRNICVGLGPVLENSTAWEVVGPWIKTIDAVLDQMNKQLSNRGTSPTLDKMLLYVKDYGVDFMQALTRVISDTDKVQMLLGYSSNIQKLCDLDSFQQLFELPSSVPTAEILNSVCSLDINSLVTEILSAYDTTMVSMKIAQFFNSSLPYGTSRDFDWENMADNLNKLQVNIETTFSGLPPQYEVWMSLNYTEFTMAGEELFLAFQNLSWAGIQSFGQFGLQSMASLDSMLQNDTTWRMVKHGLNVADIMMEMTTKRMKMMGDGTFRLEDMFENATMIGNFLQATADMAPDMVETLMNTILDPSQMVATLLTTDFQTKGLCNGLKLTDLMVFTNKADINEFERVLCSMDGEYILQQMQNAPMNKPVADAMAVFFIPWNETNPMPDIKMNWTKMSLDITEMIQVMMTPMDASALLAGLPKINMTALEIKMNSSIDNFLNFGSDLSGLQKTADMLMPLLDNLTRNMDPVSQGFWRFAKINWAMNYALLKMASQQLLKLNGATLTVTDLLPSQELKRAFRAVENSPVITDMLLNTVISFMSDPDKLTVWMDSANLVSFCTNQTVFEALFVAPDDKSIDMGEVQTLMCGANINVTILLKELSENLDGLSEIIALISGDDMSGYQLNVTEYLQLAMEYAKNLESVIMKPPTIVFPNTDYLNETVWKDVWNRFNAKLPTDLLSPNMTVMSGALLPYVEGILNSFASFPDVQTILSKANDMIEVLIIYAENAQESISGDMFAMYNDTVEMKKIIRVLENAPDLMEVLLNTMIAQDKSTPLITMLATDPLSVCRDPSLVEPYISTGGNTNVNITSLIHMFCTMDYEVLLQELNGPQNEAMTIITRVFSPNYTANFDAKIFVQNIQRGIDTITKASQSVTQLIMNSSNQTSPMPRWLDGNTWNSMFDRFTQHVAQQYNSTSPSYYMQMIIPSLRPVLSSLGPVEQQVFARINDGYMFGIELMKLMRASPAEAISMFNDTVELKKIMKMLINTPQVVEELLYLVTDQAKVATIVQGLSMGEPWTIIFDVLPNNSLVNFIAKDLNVTALMNEIATHQGDLTAPLARMISPNHNYTFSVDEYLQNLVNVQKETEKLITYVVNVAYGLVNMTDILPWLDAQQWSSMFDRFTQHLIKQNNATSPIDYTQMIVSSMKPLLSNLGPAEQQVFARISDGYLFGIEVMKLMQVSPAEALSMFNDTVELKKIMEMLVQTPQVVEELLYLLTDQAKVSRIVQGLSMGEPWTIIFDVLPNNSLVNFIAKDLNVTALMNEITTHQSDLTAPLARMISPNHNYTFSVDEYLQNLVNVQKETEKLVTYIVNVAIGGVNMTDIPPWLDAKQWSSMFDRFTQHLVKQNNATSPIDYTQMIVSSMKPLLSSLGPAEQQVFARISDGYLFGIEVMKLMQASPAEALSMFNDTVEMKKIMEMLVQTPQVVEELLYLFTDQAKVSRIVQGLSMGEPWTIIFDVLPNNSLVNFIAKDLNVTTLMNEIATHQSDLTAPLARMISPNHNYTFSVDEYLQNLVNVQKETEKLITYVVNVAIGGVNMTDIPPWLDAKQWSSMFDRFTQHLVKQYNSTSPIDYTQMIVSSMKPLLSSLGPAEQQVFARISDGYLFGIEVMKLMQVSPAEALSMFNDTVEMKKIMEMLVQTPQVVEELLYLFTDQAKVSRIVQGLSMGEPWTIIFDVLPNNSLVNFIAKDLNVTVLMYEIATHQSDLTAPLTRMISPNHNYTFSVDEYLQNLVNVQKEMEKLITYIVNVAIGGVNMTDIPPWLDAKQWSSMFDRFTQHLAKQYNSTSPIDYTQMIVSSMKPVLSNLGPADQQVFARISDGYLFGIEVMKLMQASPAKALSMFNDTVVLKKIMKMLVNTPQVVEELLYLFTDQAKVSRIVQGLSMGEPWTIIFDVLPNNSLVNFIGKDLNVTVLMYEIATHQNDLTAPLARMISPNHNYTFSVDEYLQNLVNVQKETEKLITYIVNVAIGGVNMTDIPPWLDAQQWSSMIDRYTKHMTKLFGMTGSSGDPLDAINAVMEPIVQNVLMSLNQTREVDMVMSNVNGLVKFMNSAIQLLNAPTDITQRFENTVEFKKLVGLLDQAPEIVEALLYTLTDPTKLMRFIEAAVSNSVCNTTNLEQYLVQVQGSSLNATAVKHVLCTVNYSVIPYELMNDQASMKLIEPLQGLWDPSAVKIFNVTEFFRDINTLIQTSTKLSIILTPSINGTNTQNMTVPRWLNEARWATIFSKFWNNLQAQMNVTSGGGNVLVWLNILENTWLKTQPGYQQVNSVMNTMSAVLDVVIDKLNSFNDSYAQLTDLVKSSPEMTKLLRMVNKSPDIIQVLLYSVNTEKFMPLFQRTNLTDTLVQICLPVVAGNMTQQLGRPSINIKDYLTVPAGSNIDIDALLVEFCDIDFMALVNEGQTEFNVQHIMDQVGNQAPANWSAITQQVNQLTTVMTRLVENPPKFPANEMWMNATVWLDILSKYAASQNNPENILTNIGGVIVTMAPLFDNNTVVQQMLYVLDTLQQVTTRHIQTWPGQNLTLASLLQDTPQLLSYVQQSLSLGADMQEALLHAVIKKPAELSKLASMPNAWETFCGPTYDLSAVFALPDHVDANGLRDLICKTNMTVISTELMNKFGLGSVIAKLSSGEQVKPDLEQVLRNSKELYDAINALIANPPTFITPEEFNVTAYAHVYMRFFEMINYTNVEMYKDIIDNLETTLRTTGVWKYVKQQLLPAKVMLDYMSGILNRIKPQGGEINIASLFRNPGRVVDIMDLAFNLGPDFVNAMLSTYMKPNKIVDFALLGTAGMQEVVCSEERLQEFFQFHASFNASYAVKALCGLNVTKMVEQLATEFNIGSLMSQLTDQNATFHLQSYIDSYNAYSNSLMALFNVTDVYFKDTNLAKLFTYTPVDDQTNLLAFVMNLPESSVETLAMTLQSLMPVIADMDWWKVTRPHLDVLNILVDTINDKVDHLSNYRFNMTLESILTNSDQLRTFIQQNFAIGPELVGALMYSRVDATKLDNIKSASDIFCNGILTYPAYDATKIKEVMCNANFTAIWEEIKVEINYQAIVDHLSLANTNVTLPPFNWTSTLTNMRDLAINMGSLFTNISLPPLDEFFGYNGNFTAWMIKMQSVPSSYYNLDNLPEILLGMLDQLNPLLQTSVTGRSILAYYKQNSLMMEIVHRRLLELQGKPISLDTLLVNATHTKQLLQTTLGLSSSVVETLLLSDVRFDQLSKLLTAKDPVGLLCNTSFEFLTLPPGADMNVTEFHAYLCSINVSVIVQELMAQLDIQQFLKEAAKINALIPKLNQTIDVDWSKVSQLTMDIQRLITKMIDNPPPIDPALVELFNFEKYLPALNKFMEKYQQQLTQLGNNSMDLLSLAKIFDSLTPMIESSSFGQEMLKYLQVTNLILENVNYRVAKFANSPVSLDSLLGNGTQLAQILKTTLGLAPEVITTLLKADVKPAKMRELIQMNTDDAIRSLCVSNITEFFDIPTGSPMSVQIFKTALCSIDVNVFVRELAKEYRQDILDQQISELLMPNSTANFNMTEMLANVQEMLSLATPETFANITVSPKLIELFNMTRFAPVLETLSQNDPNRLMDTLLLIAQIFEGTDVWNTSMIGFVMNSVSDQIRLMNLQLQFMTEAGFDFETVLSNRTALTEMFDRIMRQNFDLIPQAFKPTYSPMLVALLKNAPKARPLMCNETALRDIAGLPMYVNASAMSQMLCYTKPEEIFDKWVDSGLNVGELVNIITKMMTHVGYYGTTISNTVNWSVLRENLKNMVAIMDKLSSLPPGVIPGFNASYWQPILETFAESIQKNSVTGVLQTLSLLDPLLRDTDFWKDVQSYVQMSGVYMEWLADQLEKLQGAGGEMKLINLFPDVGKVTKLLESAIGRQAAAEFLTVIIQPNAVLSLTRSKDWPSLFCNRTAFMDMFKFPAGSDVQAIQTQLCQSVKNNSLVVDQLMSLIDVKMIVKEIERLATPADKRKPVTQDPWKNLLKQAQRVMLSIELVQKLGNVNMGGFEDYLRPITATLTLILDPSANNIGGMCDGVLSLVDKTEIYGYMEAGFLTSQTVIEVMEDMLRLIPGVSDLICDLPSMDIIGMIVRLDKMNIIDLMWKFDKMISQNFTGDDFQCSSYISQQMRLNDLFNSTINTMPKLAENMGQCIQSLFTSDFKAFNDVDFYISLLKELQYLMNNGSLQSIGQIDGLAPVINMFLRGLTSQQPFITELQSLFSNVTDVQQILSGMADLTPRMVQAFLQSSINLNVVDFFNQTVDEISSVMCSPKKLGETFTISPILGVDINELSKQLCGPNVTQLAGTLKNAVNIGQALSMIAQKNNGIFNINWLNSITDDLMDIVKYAGELIDLQALLGNGFDIDSLSELIPKIQEFVTAGGPDKLFESIYSFIQKLVAVADTPESKEFLTNMELLARGLRGLNIFNQLFPNVALKDVLNDPQNMRSYLIETVNLSPKVSEQILNATLQYSLFIGQNASKVNVTALFCDPAQLSTLMTFDKDVDVAKVSQALCSLNTSMLTAITSGLVKKLDIGNMVKEMMTFDGNNLFESSNISLTDLKQTIDQLKPLSTDLSNALTSLKNFTGSAKIPSFSNVIDPSTGMFQASQGLSSLSSMLCGDAKALDFDSSSFGILGDASDSGSAPQIPGLTASTSATPTTAAPSSGSSGNSNGGNSQNLSPQSKYATAMRFFPDDVKADFFSLPSDFCRDLYIEMSKSESASVIWHYLKPLLRGTILFTPDTPAVRRIIKGANATFEEIAKLKNFAQLISSGSDGLSQLLNTDFSKLETAMKNPFVSTVVQQSTGLSGQDLVGSLTNFGNMSAEEFANIKTIADLVVSFLDCVNLDMFQPMNSVEEAHKLAQKLANQGKFLASVEFLNMDVNRKKRDTSDSIPKHITYKIRMDADAVPKTESIKDPLWTPGPKDNFALDMKYMRGFIQLQEMLDHSIIAIHAERNITMPVTYLQQEPYPCYENDNFVHWFRFVIPIMMTLAFIFVIANAIRLAVYDKQTGMDETMKIMGLHSSADWLAWFLNIFIGLFLMSILLVVILKVSGILRYSDPIILGLFFITFSFSTIMFCYLVSVFFSRTNLAALTGILVYLITFLPYVFVTVLDQQLLFWHNTLVCLSSTSAFSLGSAYVTRFEEQGTGIQWDNINTSPIAGDNLTLSWCCIMMLIDAAIYGFIAWYIRNVFPGKYGMPQPWYFFMTPRYWGCCLSAGKGSKYKSSKSARVAENGDDSVNETLMESLPVGISIDGMTKRYKKGKPAAVDNLRLDFYEGQVSAFLGHNGAGKTTTIKTIIGMFPPTSGTAYICDKDVRTQFSEIRSELGYCPQHDTLFEDMTVKEHMMFFAQLKTGLAAYKVKQEVKRMLKKIELDTVRHEIVSNLSGGQRRRLAVAIAFIGDSRVIILDEPTSGVDPAARRRIWDVISKNREDRTVVLCTHHLDEAEVIGDRIAILHKGHLLCSGSPMFLRNKFGEGYQLTISKTEVQKEAATSELFGKGTSVHIGERELWLPKYHDETNQAKVTDFIQQHVPGSRLMSSLGSQLIYMLPVERQDTFHTFFLELEQNMTNLGIANYGVSDTTLERIYVKVCQGAEDTGKGNSAFTGDTDSGVETDSQKSSEVAVNVDTTTPILTGNRTSGCGLKMQQLGALLAKRFHHHKRYLRGYLSTIILPTLLMLLAMGSSLVVPRNQQQPPLQMQTSLYQPSNVYFKNADSSILLNKDVANAFTGPNGIGTVCMPSANMTLLDHGMKKITAQCDVRPDTDFTSPSVTDEQKASYAKAPKCYCDAASGRQVCPEGAEGAPVPYMIANSTDTIHNLAEEDVNDWIVRTHQQFVEKRYGGWVMDKSAEGESMATVYFNNKGYHAMTTFMNAMSNSLLRATVNASQDNPSDYGITAYSHPLLFTSGVLDIDTLYQRAADTGISVCILCAFSFIPAGFVIYLVNERNKKEKHMQHLAGVGSTLYWTSAFIWDLFSCIWPVGISAGLMAAFNISVFTANQNLQAHVLLLFLFCWAAIPFCYLLSRPFKNTSTAYMMSFIVNFFLGVNTTTTMFLLGFFLELEEINLVYSYLKYVFLIFPQYALGGGLVALAGNQLQAEVFLRFNVNKYVDPFTMKMLAPNYMALAVAGVVFFIMNLLLDIRCRSRSSVSRTDDKYAEDEDVTMERKRVAHSSGNDNILAVSGLSKVYHSGLRKVLAVDNITFGVPKGECFGLLGVNGAGKSTTFKMLTGDIGASEGDAYLQNDSILSSISNMEGRVGYCPQVDALDDYLTGKEVLTIYAKLKGITGRDIDTVVSNALAMMDLTANANKKTKDYSGGMKRKLSAALALLGDPQIVFMDEPTSGMDPISRRLLWKHIQNVIKDERSVILTSHSMAECDALCTRLAIMVNGQFKCLGNPQHIKSKYGDGYTVQIRASPGALDNVRVYIRNTFPQAIIKEHQHNILEFHTAYCANGLSNIFENMERQKKPLQILDYSVSQTTLDQVFVRFATHQSDGTLLDGLEEYPSTSEGSTPKSQRQPAAYASNLLYASPNELQLQTLNGKKDLVANETEITNL